MSQDSSLGCALFLDDHEKAESAALQYSTVLCIHFAATGQPSLPVNKTVMGAVLVVTWFRTVKVIASALKQVKWTSSSNINFTLCISFHCSLPQMQTRASLKVCLEIRSSKELCMQLKTKRSIKDRVFVDV